jgi:GNAT superfamily N-acetyltransferase
MAARCEGKLVGRAMFLHLADDPDVAWGDAHVLPAYRRRGIGGALLDSVERLARESGRRRLIVYAPSADGPGPLLRPPTGAGAVPADNPEVRFLSGRGYSLEQVERCGRLPLPVPAATSALLHRAGRAAGPDYRVVVWSGPTPVHRQVDMADLYTVMSVEEPSAGLDEPPDVWTVERLVAAEQQDADGARTRLVAAAEHVSSGRLVAFTVLSVPLQTTRPVAQEDTLVVPGHRGRRLGMLLKLANIEQLQRVRPGHPAVITYNAEENRHMLDVNEAIGFLPIGREGAWKKSFDPV